MTLAHFPSPAYPSPVAAKSAHGIGVPENEGGHRLRAVFLCPQHGKSFMGGPCGAAQAAPVPSYRYANLHGSAHPDWRRGGGKQHRYEGSTAMTPRRTLTLVPPSRRTRAAQHRRLALAALKLDSSLSVRLSRYWRHIERARLLERAEVAK